MFRSPLLTLALPSFPGGDDPTISSDFVLLNLPAFLTLRRITSIRKALKCTVLMRFGNWQNFAATLVLAPALALFLAWAWRARQRQVVRFVPARLLAMLTASVSPQRQKFRLALLFSVFVLVGVSLARPQWGFEYRPTKQQGLDIIVCIDTSKSMLAEDVTPNRLAKAKLAILDLRKVAKSDRIGLVAFAGSAFMQMPMSTDDDVLRQNLEAIDTDLLPQGGTAITEAIQTARAAFKDSGLENHRAIVMFTDGEDHDGEAIEAAKKAAAEGAVVLTVGVGTTSGELIPIRDAKGRTSFVKDEAGNTVKSRLNEALLQEIAKAGNGFYVPLAGAGIIETLYERGLAPLPKREVESTPTQVYHERYQWFLGLALALILAEMLVSDRRKHSRASSGVGGASHAGSSAVMIGALLCVGLLPDPAHASASGARKDYEAGKYKTALTEYQRLLEKQPNDPALQYNAGSAAFHAGRFDAATDHFTSALSTPDPKLQQHAYYNRGNSQTKQGEEADDASKKMEHWKKAVSDYESTLKLNSTDDDAKANMDLVKKRIEALEQQQQNQQKNDSNKDDKKDDKKKDEKKDQSKQDQDQQSQDQKGDESSDPKKDSKQKQDSKPEKSEDEKKQDSQSQQSQDSDKKDGKEQPQPKPGDDKDSKDQQKDASQGQQPKDERDKKPGMAPGKEGAEGGDKDKEQPEGPPQPGKMMQMTRRDAIRLLEALRFDERLLRPMPPQTNRTQRTIKNW